MKKVIIIVFLISVGLSMYAQEIPDGVRTSEGDYFGTILFIEQQWRETYRLLPTMNQSKVVSKISNGQWQLVNKLLNHYRTSTGDMYFIKVNWYVGSRIHRVHLLCEFTSNTQYKYWMWSEPPLD